ncbi:pyroglutamyl-peptidase I [Actinomadura sp. HBU206391]|uniref:pyroglutamyl-peptidase I n=1 Tax=Actinomadura sp. HBU206391 TaxID=2731692 RepID=UPI00164EF749|nr:pyroglutamyl-peptidase I [Actinomadura sp. HBU206391]MBC6457638.1 pyroglutamyl-peptidase I [Actinomadura sp. HBU206391]
MTRVLLTGFEPFGDSTVNPSWQAVRLAAATPPEGVSLTTAVLPVVFHDANERLRAAVEESGAEVVVCVGQAGGRAGVTVERVAINLDDARIPDNAGGQPLDEPVVAGGPAAYFATLPVKACVAAVRAAGLPASVSHTAGTYLCNHVFYGLMHLIETERPHVRGGFVHVPYAPEQVPGGDEPSMSAPAIAAALTAILSAAVTTTADLKVTGGSLH